MDEEKIGIWICEPFFYTSDSLKPKKKQSKYNTHFQFVFVSCWLTTIDHFGGGDGDGEKNSQSLFSASFVHYSEVESCAESTYRHELSQLLKIRESHSSGKVYFFFFLILFLCKFM